MARTGRPPRPVEVKRALGNPGKRKLPDVADVVVLPQAEGIPDAPVDLGLEGLSLWSRVWGSGISWISPASDWVATVEACRLSDDVSIARRRYAATSDPTDGRAVVALSKRLGEALSALGFDPAARTRLGVAEVKRVSALERLIADNQNR